jgi:hypothetical protein
MALANELPDAIITESGLKITPLDAAVPDRVQLTKRKKSYAKTSALPLSFAGHP